MKSFSQYLFQNYSYVYHSDSPSNAACSSSQTASENKSVENNSNFSLTNSEFNSKHVEI